MYTGYGKLTSPSRRRRRKTRGWENRAYRANQLNCFDEAITLGLICGHCKSIQDVPLLNDNIMEQQSSGDHTWPTPETVWLHHMERPKRFLRPNTKTRWNFPNFSRATGRCWLTIAVCEQAIVGEIASPRESGSVAYVVSSEESNRREQNNSFSQVAGLRHRVWLPLAVRWTDGRQPDTFSSLILIINTVYFTFNN